MTSFESVTPVSVFLWVVFIVSASLPENTERPKDYSEVTQTLKQYKQFVGKTGGKDIQIRHTPNLSEAKNVPCIYVPGIDKYIFCRKAVAKTSAVPSLAVYVAQDCTGETFRLDLCSFVNLSTVCCSERLTLRCLLYTCICFSRGGFCALQCTKRTWCGSVTCHWARLPLTHPAKPGSPSSYWCLCGWEERPSTRPTSNVSRSEHPAPISWLRCPPLWCLLKDVGALRPLSYPWTLFFVVFPPQNILKLDCCIGIIGGKPKHSLYFVGFQGENQKQGHPKKNFILNLLFFTCSIQCSGDPH